MTGPVTPRWEWRCFGVAEDPFSARVPERIEESDELYLLSRESDASVKVRDGLMDVKHRLEVDADGLEQWAPVMKAPFPLSARRCRLGARDPAAWPGRYASSTQRRQLVDELVGARPRPARGRGAQAARALHDRRLHGGADRACGPASGTTRTVAVEAEDPARVIAAVRELGLAARPNVCCARGLKALVGFGARRFAVIDVGTNSVKFHVGERRRRRRRGARSSTAPRSRGSARASSRRARSAASRSRGPSRRSPAWPTRPRATAPRRSRRSGPPGCGSRRNARRSSTRSQARSGVASRSSPARRRRGSPTWRRAPALGPAPGRASCSTPAAAARSSRSATATRSTSGSASTSARCASPSGSGSTAPSPRRRSPRRCAAIAADLGRSTAGRAGRGRRHGRRGHQPGRGQARPRRLRPRRRARHRARPRRDRPADRALPHPRRRGAPRRSSGCSPTRAEVILAGACIVRTVLDEARPRRR